MSKIMIKFKISFYYRFLCICGIIQGICWFMILPRIFEINISIFSVYDFLLILLGAFSIFIFIFCLLSLVKYKIIVNNNIIEIYGPFKKRKIDLNLYDNYRNIFIHVKLPNVIKLFSLNCKDVSIWCIFAKEKDLINIIENKFNEKRNNNHKWYYDFVNKNKVRENK
jgi:hypothetical protein